MSVRLPINKSCSIIERLQRKFGKWRIYLPFIPVPFTRSVAETSVALIKVSTEYDLLEQTRKNFVRHTTVQCLGDHKDPENPENPRTLTGIRQHRSLRSRVFMILATRRLGGLVIGTIIAFGSDASLDTQHDSPLAHTF